VATGFGLVPGGAQCGHQPLGQNAVVVANHYLRHLSSNFLIPVYRSRPHTKTHPVEPHLVNSHAARGEDAGASVN
jgi:hypothetical protein